MFYARTTELSKLEKHYESDKMECIVIYGRRRVGKTSLIRKFTENKPTIFFSALNVSSLENLEFFSDAIYAYTNPEQENAPQFRSYDDALQMVGSLAKEKRVVMVIDEYPYLAKAEKSISSRLQHLIDHEWRDTKLYLILCGSSMSFMEYQVLGYESPLIASRLHNK